MSNGMKCHDITFKEIPTIVVFCRYFKDKVFNGKAFWQSDEEEDLPRPMSADEKAAFLNMFSSVRDAPSEEMYKEREDDFKSATSGFTVRPGK